MTKFWEFEGGVVDEVLGIIRGGVVSTKFSGNSRGGSRSRQSSENSRVDEVGNSRGCSR